MSQQVLSFLDFLSIIHPTDILAEGPLTENWIFYFLTVEPYT